MSYLEWPRLIFSGRFQADTSTINNDVRHYKSDAFQPQFQAPMVGYGQGGGEQRTNGYWNPNGTGAWRMLGCRITGLVLDGTLITKADKAVILGKHIAGSSDRVAGKLVDLDPQQQLVSEIWGLRIALEDDQGNRLFDSHFDVAAFIDLWKRQQVNENFDQTLAAAYQSTLSDIRWGDLSQFPSVQKLRAASKNGLLSIRFNCFGFDRDPAANDYTTGLVVGSIGPASKKEPKHFVLGRRLESKLAGNPFTPLLQVNGFQALVNSRKKTLTVDLGNSLPIYTAAGDLLNLGELSMAVAKNSAVGQGDVVEASDVAVLGAIPYQPPSDWYFQSAGIVDFNYSDDPWITENIGKQPLLLLKTLSGDKPEDKTYQVIVRETQDGLYVRADQFVYRLDPGDKPSQVAFYATRYGKPTATTLTIDFDKKGINITGPGTGAVLNPEKWPVPTVGTPKSALKFKTSLSIDSSGYGVLDIANIKKGPGHPRQYLDGQIYALRYSMDNAPTGYTSNFWNFLSILAFDFWKIPAEPTWHRDIEPIFVQYANLYPIMSRYMVDLSDYDSVVKFVEPLILSFSLDLQNPNSMPVSRDLSANKRTAILKWLTEPGPGGLPRKGKPSQRKGQGEGAPPWPTVAIAEVADQSHGLAEPGGKFDFMMQMFEAQRKLEEGDHAQD